MDITLETVLTRSSGLVSSEIDEDIVLMSVETGRYYSISNVGASIWNLLAEPLSVYEICQGLMSEYEIDPVRCKDEVLVFIRQLKDEGIVASL